MSNTKIKAAQFHGVVGHGTDGYFLMTNADGSMSWAQGGASGPSVTSVDYPGDDLAADPNPDTPQSVVLTGTNFGSSMSVTIGGTAATAVAHDSSTQLTVTIPSKPAGDYDIVVTNTVTGTSGTFVNGISYNGVPTWTTAAGSLGTFESETTISTITLQATEPDNGTITFNITNGALPTGLSLTGANIDGTTTAESSTTLYSFTIEAIDDENQATPRNFSITVNSAEIVPSQNFTINTYEGNGSTQSIEGKIGTAASFNGSSSYINLGSASSLVSTNFTFSAWIKTTATSTDWIIGTNINPYYSKVGVRSEGDGTLTCRYGNYTSNENAFSSSYNTINNGEWHHIVYFINQTTAKLYIDGSLDTTHTLTVTPTTNGNLTLGTYYNDSNNSYGSAAFEGTLDQVRIFNKELSSSEITTLYNEPSNLGTASTTDIFDDGSGVALYEFEKGAIDTGGTNGYIGRAGVFNGSSSVIDLGNNSSNNSSIISASLWFKTSGHSSTATLINNGGANSGETGYFLGLTSNGYIRFNITSSVDGTINYADGEWHNVVMTINNGSYNIYIDGNTTPVLTGTQSFSTTATRPTFIGKFSHATANIEFWDGEIDQVRIFNKVLSTSEVTTLYNETSASSTKSTTDIFDDGSGVVLYELEGNANDTGGNIGSLVSSPKIDLDVDGYTSGSVADLSGNSNTATVTGATYGTDPNGGGYFDFDGSSDYLQISSNTDFQSTSNFTVEMWVKPDSLGFASLSNIYTTTAGNRKYNLVISDADGDLEFNTYSTSGGTVLSGNNPNLRIQTGVWNHIVAVYEQNVNQEIFINGVSHASTTPSTTIETGATQPLLIGALGSYIGTYDFDGQIGDVRFYDSALSSSQIAQNFNASKGEYGVNYYGTATNVSYGYDGTPTDVSFVGTSFQPDLVWIKARDGAAEPHQLFDSIRGVTKELATNSTGAEDTSSVSIDSFDSNGFSLNSDPSLRINKSSINYVAWCCR